MTDMLIKQRRVRSLSSLNFLKEGNSISFGVNLDNIDKNRGISSWISSISDNVLFLPPVEGPISRFNAEGKEEKLKDLPMETCYSEIYWTRHQRAGRGITQEITEVAYRPYHRYPREYISPVGIELFKRDNYVYGPVLKLGEDNERIKHTINLFLEIFGECEVLSENLEPLMNVGKMRYNWEFIKPGEWGEFKKKVMSVAQNKSDSQKKIIQRRIAVAEKLGLSAVGVGILGFRGYIAFQSKDKRYTIFENVNYGNAIYITDMNWEDFSKQDKQTILSIKMQKDRIIHRKGWENKLRKYC